VRNIFKYYVSYKLIVETQKQAENAQRALAPTDK